MVGDKNSIMFRRMYFVIMPMLVAGVIITAGCVAPSLAAEPTVTAPGDADARFVNKVWRVETSSGVAAGTLYVFLSDGTLLISSPYATPALGRWTFTDGALTMVEESIAYKVDVLKLDRETFVIRSHNPGEAVKISMVRASAPH